MGDHALPACGRAHGPSVLLLESGSDNVRHDVESIAKRHSHYGFNFVPLVTKELDLICSLDILLLRPRVTIDSAWTGDVDNRLKTLIDALQSRSPMSDGVIRRRLTTRSRSIACWRTTSFLRRSLLKPITC